MSHELFGEDFGAFKFSGIGLGAKNAEALLGKNVDNSLCQRIFRADDGQVDLSTAGQLQQGSDVVGLDRFIDDLAFKGGSCVAWGAVDLGDPGGLGQLPAQGMFPTAASDNQYLQGHDPSFMRFFPYFSRMIRRHQISNRFVTGWRLAEESVMMLGPLIRHQTEGSGGRGGCSVPSSRFCWTMSLTARHDFGEWGMELEPNEGT